jgi:hypothetical protein
MKMNKNDRKEKLISFSQPKSYLFFANHIDKIFYVLLLIALIVNMERMKGQFFIDVSILTAFLCILIYLFSKFIKRFSWRFDIDFNSDQISFYLCRKTDIEVINFDEITEIKVSGPIMINVNGRKIYYSTANYLDVLSTLKKVKDIKWGKMCDLLGPDKKTRSKIENINRVNGRQAMTSD